MPLSIRPLTEIGSMKAERLPYDHDGPKPVHDPCRTAMRGGAVTAARTHQTA